MSLESEAIAIWNKTVGTPKNIDEAIDNAIEELFQKNFSLEEIPIVFKKHIKDLLGQKFTPFMAGDGSVVDTTAQALWDRIMGIK